MLKLESKLLTIFQIVNEWLKFAETKNAGLILISGAGSAAIMTYLASSHVISTSWKKLLLASVLFFVLGAVISLISFIPRTNLKYLLQLIEDWGKPDDKDNLYFFKDLAKYEAEPLASAMLRLYFPQLDPTPSPNKEQLDLAAQIITNSRVTVLKFRIFTVAVWSVILGAILVIVGLIIHAL